MAKMIVTQAVVTVKQGTGGEWTLTWTLKTDDSKYKYGLHLYDHKTKATAHWSTNLQPNQSNAIYFVRESQKKEGASRYSEQG